MTFHLGNTAVTISKFGCSISTHTADSVTSNLITWNTIEPWIFFVLAVISIGILVRRKNMKRSGEANAEPANASPSPEKPVQHTARKKRRK